MIEYYYLICMLLYMANMNDNLIESRCETANSPMIYLEKSSTPGKTIVCCLGGTNFVEWRRNKISIPTNPSNFVLNEDTYSLLILYDTDIQSDTTYSCILNSTNGINYELPILVTQYATTMEYKPEQYLLLTKDQTVFLGSKDSLVMIVEWIKRGVSKPLVIYDPTNPKQPKKSRYTVDGYGNLHIKGVRVNDTGTYAANLMNSDGQIKETKQFQVYAGSPPFRAIYPRDKYYFTIGDIGVIQCSTYGIGLNNYWLFRSKTTNKETRIERDSLNKYRMEMDGTLSISNIEISDIGTYTCISKNLYGTLSSTTTVSGIIRPAKIIRLNNGYGRVGTSVSMVCEVDGDPPPTITWWRNNQPVSNFRYIGLNASELFFDYMIQGDAGIYTCVADNNATKNGVKVYDEKDVELYNEEKPFINTNLSSKVEFVTKYTSVARIRCVSENLPFSRLYLTFKNKEISGAGISINKDMNQIVLDYVFSYNDSSQLGIYTCVAENTYGYDSINILVSQLDEPDPPFNIRISNLDTTSVVISWDYPKIYLDSKYHDFQVLYFTRNKFFFSTALVKTNSIKLEGLLRDTDYFVQIRSHILSGWSEPSKTLTFKTLKNGSPLSPTILNSELLLKGIDIHLMWEYPIRNYNDSNYVFSVEWCRLDYFNITNLQNHCNLVSDLYSTEFMITGLVADNFYVVNVGASNFYGSKFSEDFIIIAGKNPYIGAVTSSLDSIFISLIVILLMLLIVLLIDLIMLILYSYGVIYFIYTIFTAKWPNECVCNSKYKEFESTEYARLITTTDENNQYNDIILNKDKVYHFTHEIDNDHTTPGRIFHSPVAYEYAQDIPYSYESDGNRIKFVSYSDRSPKRSRKILLKQDHNK